MSGKDTVCRVCEYPYVQWDGLCGKCMKQRDTVMEIRRQKKRDAEFGNIWEEAGVKDDNKR